MGQTNSNYKLKKKQLVFIILPKTPFHNIVDFICEHTLSRCIYISPKAYQRKNLNFLTTLNFYHSRSKRVKFQLYIEGKKINFKANRSVCKINVKRSSFEDVSHPCTIFVPKKIKEWNNVLAREGAVFLRKTNSEEN